MPADRMSDVPPIRRIAVAGAGAIGCTLAARLASAGQAVSLLARGAALTAIAREGLRLDDLDGTHRVPAGALRVSDDAAALGPQDLVLYCAKSQDLAALAEAAAPLVGAHTLLLPLVNGVPWWYFHGAGGRYDGERVQAVDPDGRLAAALPLPQVLGTVVFVTAELAAPGHARSRTPHLLMLGEPAAEGGAAEPGKVSSGEAVGSVTPRLLAACAALSRAGVEARALPQIRDALWTKLIGNVVSNPLSVVTGATLEQLFGDAELLPLAETVLREALLAAAAYGARVTVDPKSFVEQGRAMGAFRTSMLQDYERGRPLELAAIGDAVLELAARLDIPMPMTRRVVDLARWKGRQRAAECAAHAPLDPTCRTEPQEATA